MKQVTALEAFDLPVNSVVSVWPSKSPYCVGVRASNDTIVWGDCDTWFVSGDKIYSQVNCIFIESPENMVTVLSVPGELDF